MLLGLARFSQVLAKNMSRYLVQTFGCQMNVHDAQRMESMLCQEGYEATYDPTQADVIIFNTCSVREKAEHKLLSMLGTYKDLKRERPQTVFVVAGCVAQQEGQRLLKRAEVVDIVMGPDNIAELPGLIREIQQGAPGMVRTVFDVDDPRFLHIAPEVDQHSVTGFVTVMKGCDERCTFCIVPYTRGPERYRDARDIIDEVRALCDRGVREVTLLGQTVNSWYDPSTIEPKRGISQFAGLLRRIASEVPKLARLRYTSPHPRHITAELLDAYRDVSILPSHVHLPLQSGSNRVLKRMLRRYTREEFIEHARALYAVRPEMALSTDIIVGFPGETEDDFQATLSLVREVKFASVFAFKYSQRPFTPALKLVDDVSEEEKDRRLSELLALAEALQSESLASLVGSTQSVLIEGLSRNASLRTQEGDNAGVDRVKQLMGRTFRNEIVMVDDHPNFSLVGQVIDVNIVRANRHSLFGQVVEASIQPIAKNAVAMAPKRPKKIHLPLSVNTNVPLLGELPV